MEKQEMVVNNIVKLYDVESMTRMIASLCEEKNLMQTAAALTFATEKHQGQFRKVTHDGKRNPYITHPLLMTCHAIALGMKEDEVLAACLLHDVCEDCGVAVKELPVGDEAKEAVRLLTKSEDYDHSQEMTKDYYDAMAENRAASFVKVLDRCHNISEMSTSFSEKRIMEYLKETEDYVMPLLANAEKNYPELSPMLFVLKYHMNSVLEALKFHARESR